jgi:TfoX/Sxy family transcriptional regulator of competence genes
MAYDPELERRIDKTIAGWDLDVPKKKMFGGLAYFINGNMAFGIHHANELIVKADEEQGDELTKEPGMGPFVMGNRRSMKNWYLAQGEALDGDNFVRLLEISRDYTLTLPPKIK